MTGWRLGWLVIPEYALEATQRLAQHLFICAPSFARRQRLPVSSMTHYEMPRCVDLNLKSAAIY